MSRILGPAIHQAYVVPDFDEGIARFAALGIGPFYTLHSLGGMSRFRGEEHPITMSAAFVYSGDCCFEIIAADATQQTTYAEFLRRNPAGGLHHIAYFSADFDATLAALEAEGKPHRIVQDFGIEIYCEPVGVDNPVNMQLIRPGLFDGWFDAMREAAANWDGSDPIRDARPLMAAAMAKAGIGAGG
ncbi:MAG TPA: VOC family protein [Novosphingobium sp.]|nr:VOC family protein [Novosphingobium sp.]HMP55629.1 VOC family protein [Novosphingobium sp.]